MKRALQCLLLCLAALAPGDQLCRAQDPCQNGLCPIVPRQQADAGAASLPSEDALAVVRISNACQAGRAFGSGTIVESGPSGGLVVTCAHLFRDGAGQLTVQLVDGRSFPGKLLKIDQVVDLAAIE